MPGRKHCPSCQQRLSPFAVECPVCGLVLARRELPRPLLFQASALHGRPPEPRPEPRAISAPAFGRIQPLEVEAPTQAAPPPAPPPQTLPPPPGTEIQESTFWRLVNLEAGEAVLLAALNTFLALLPGWMTGSPHGRAWAELWPLLLPVHACVSWSLLMIPMVLAGQSPLMGLLGVALDASQPERRMSFSLFHLVSVACFPVSFLCMVLTPAHRTLAELLTGQELVVYARSRLR